MKKISYLTATVAAILTLGSCGEKFFEQYPSNSVTEGNFYQSEDDFNQGVYSCYYKLKTGIGWFINELSYRADECRLESMAVSTQDRYDLDHFAVHPSNSLIESEWNAWYNGIYRCNDVLDHMPAEVSGNMAVYRGECLFIRSWHYYNLYVTFGVVPIVTKVETPGDSRLIPRCTEEQMYERLYNDLTEAASLLPASRSTEKGRVCDIAAWTLLAKAQLVFGKYDEAIESLKKAKDNPNFGLADASMDPFNVNNKLNKEIIFAACYDKSNDAGHGYWHSSNTAVEADRQNPTKPFKDLFSASDARANMIAYTKISSSVYAMNKWYDTYDATYTTIVGNDFPFLRYADIELMYAEALWRQGKTEEACTYLNKTRGRAGLGTFTTTDPDAFVKELADERARELCFEGHRWYDLVRLGLAVDYFSSLGYNVDSHHLLMPIPQSQIEIYNNSSILWQNPGF